MQQGKIEPSKITKPIQLLAAWLTGLVIVNGTFLTAASQITTPKWAPSILIIASLINVPLFLISIFLLQTKYRPEMQEDSFYSKYLDRKYSEDTIMKPSEDIEYQSEKLINTIVKEMGSDLQDKRKQIETIVNEAEIESIVNRVQKNDNRTISELYLYPKRWAKVYDRWKDNPDFGEDFNQAVIEGLVTYDGDKIQDAKLTGNGKKVADILSNRNALANQKYPNIDKDLAC